MMNYPTIKQIIKIEPLCLTVLFSDGTVKVIDFHGLLDNPVFISLSDFSFFKQVKIDQGGYGLVWNEDLDISESYLWENGKITA